MIFLAATATALSSTSHRIYPGRLGTAFRIKQCVPRNDALAIGEKALALPPSAWASDRHASYATLDTSAHDVEPDFDSIVWSRVRARLAHCYDLPEQALCLIDAFVVRYDAAAGESAELAPHRDAGPLSFNVLLSDGDAFDGGATTFVDAEFDGGDEDAGDAVLHPGQTRHGGRRTTRGTRIIAVGFVDFFMVISTSINQSGQTLELIAILMGGFLVINYSMAWVLNRVNDAIKLKGTQLRT